MLLVGVGVVAILAVLGINFIGCPRTEVDEETKEEPVPQKTPREYLEAAGARLSGGRSAADRDPLRADSARDAVENLNDYLKALGPEKPDLHLKAPERARCKTQFGLGDNDLAELDSPVFTLLDAYYLEFCFELADVARSLDLQGLSTLQRARLAFDWVVRQVSLKERDRQINFSTVPDTLLPPQFVLQLGQGTAKERALLFLALLQQLDIDGGMLAYPAGEGQWDYWIPVVFVPHKIKDRKDQKPAPGVYLFDTRLGIPLPDPQGAGPVRLDQVLRDPAAVRALFPRGLRERGVPEEIGQLEIHLACPLSALAPRMRFMQRKLLTTARVNLALDSREFLRRCRKAAPVPVRFWSQAGQTNNPARVLSAFVMPSRGNLAARLQGLKGRQVAVGVYLKDFPATLDPSLYPLLVNQIDPVVTNMMVAHTALVRGQVDKAFAPLAKTGEHLRNQREFYLAEAKNEQEEKDLDRRFDEWASKMTEAQSQVKQIEEELKEAGQDNFETREKLDRARKALETLWKKNDSLVQALLYRSLAGPLGKESAYLLCLCNQEKAERVQTLLDRLLSSSGRDRAADKALGSARLDAHQAWDNAADRWGKSYAADFAVSEEVLKTRLAELLKFEKLGHGRGAKMQIATALYEALTLDMIRTVAARLLQARALEKSGQRAKAIALLDDQLRDLAGWESKGHLETLKKFVNRHADFVNRGNPYTRPDSVRWMGATVSYQLQRLKSQEK
jgi:hypothetical protein